MFAAPAKPEDWLSARSGSTAGSVFLDGGSSDPQVGAEFGTLAGGRKARLLLVPTALPEVALNQVNLDAMPQTGRDYFGVDNVVILHANSRAEADSEAFCLALENSDAIFFMGGDHNRLLERYAGTKFEVGLWKFHQRGGVIGGNSAGAMVLGSYQAHRPGAKGGRIVDRPQNLAGFALLANTLVDVHFSERRRRDHVAPILRSHPGLRAIGIDERTALIVHSNGTVRVVGGGTVTLFLGRTNQILRAR